MNSESNRPASNVSDPAVPDVLDQLRRRIRRYVLLHGSALVLVVLGCAFWLSLAVDYWFEPATSVRQALLLIALAAIAAAFAWHLVLRLVRHFRTRALALVPAVFRCRLCVEPREPPREGWRQWRVDPALTPSRRFRVPRPIWYTSR